MTDLIMVAYPRPVPLGNLHGGKPFAIATVTLSP